MSLSREDHAVERIKLELQVEALSEELAYYRSRAVGASLAVTLDPMFRFLREIYGTTPAETRLTLALYRAKGEVVSRSWLEDNIPGDEVLQRSNNVAVVVSKLRQKLGGTETIQNIWGEGYRMSETVHSDIAKRLAMCDHNHNNKNPVA